MDYRNGQGWEKAGLSRSETTRGKGESVTGARGKVGREGRRGDGRGGRGKEMGWKGESGDTNRL